MDELKSFYKSSPWSAISSDLPCKEDNAWFTTVTLKLLSYQQCERYLIPIIPICFLCEITSVEKSQMKIISFRNYELWYLIYTWSDKGFKGIVVNRDFYLSTVGHVFFQSGTRWHCWSLCNFVSVLASTLLNTYLHSDSVVVYI